MYFIWRALFITGLVLLGTTAEDPVPTTTKRTSTTTTTTTSSSSTTSGTTPIPPSTFFPCKDNPSSLSCEKTLSGDKKYCNKESPTYALARVNCCYTCAMALGFTVTKPKRVRQPDGQVITVFINVLDLTSQNAILWSYLPKTNSIYPGLTAAQTHEMCNRRVKVYGAKRFCFESLARTICGEACLEYNYPNKSG